MTQLGSKKSRKGCSQCKRRRVKCDESSPCANCVRRSEQCSLMYPASPMERTGTVAATNIEDWLQDLELMHQYSHRTSRTKLGGNTNLLHLWQEYIPVEATRHSFLMHGVLALSALHIACSRPVLIDKYTSLCDKHQASALASYRHILTHITDDTANALFALATILSLSSVARATLRASQMPEPKYISLDSICELLYLTRGVREVKEAAGDVINRGPFSVVLFGHDKSAAGHVRLSPQILGLFRLLERMIHDNCADPDQKKLCLESFKYLQDVYEATLARYLAGDLTTGTIWRWTALVSYEFIKLVQAEFPPALIITAHFVVLTLMLRELWYVGDYGDFAYEGIRIALKGQLSEYLQWAEEQIASDAAGLKHDAAFLEIPIGGQDEYVTISRGMTPMIQTPLAE